MAEGYKIVDAATNGSFSKLKKLMNDMNSENLFFYFVAKAFQGALQSGHLMIAAYFLDNGYPLNADGVPFSLHDCLSIMPDDLCLVVIQFLVSRGIDVNKQVPKTWMTALHIAIERKLVQCVAYLLESGADVNAVAAKDIMPLNIAQSLDANFESKEKIIDSLINRGARDTWRRDPIKNSSETNGNSSTMLSIGKSVTKGIVRTCFYIYLLYLCQLLIIIFSFFLTTIIIKIRRGTNNL